MASHTSIVLIDDLDGTPAAETVEFGIDGEAFEIDLTAEHAEQLRAAIAPYRALGRRVPSRSARRARADRRADSSAERQRNQRIREWAAGRGLAVATRGRMPGGVAAAYCAAHPDDRPTG